jgi:hypothetical protein
MTDLAEPSAHEAAQILAVDTSRAAPAALAREFGADLAPVVGGVRHECRSR